MLSPALKCKYFTFPIFTLLSDDWLYSCNSGAYLGELQSGGKGVRSIRILTSAQAPPKRFDAWVSGLCCLPQQYNGSLKMGCLLKPHASILIDAHFSWFKNVYLDTVFKRKKTVGSVFHTTKINVRIGGGCVKYISLNALNRVCDNKSLVWAMASPHHFCQQEQTWWQMYSDGWNNRYSYILLYYFGRHYIDILTPSIDL